MTDHTTRLTTAIRRQCEPYGAAIARAGIEEHERKHASGRAMRTDIFGRMDFGDIDIDAADILEAIDAGEITDGPEGAPWAGWATILTDAARTAYLNEPGGGIGDEIRDGRTGNRNPNPHPLLIRENDLLGLEHTATSADRDTLAEHHEAIRQSLTAHPYKDDRPRADDLLRDALETLAGELGVTGEEPERPDPAAPWRAWAAHLRAAALGAHDFGTFDDDTMRDLSDRYERMGELIGTATGDDATELADAHDILRERVKAANATSAATPKPDPVKLDLSGIMK